MKIKFYSKLENIISTLSFKEINSNFPKNISIRSMGTNLTIFNGEFGMFYLTVSFRLR